MLLNLDIKNIAVIEKLSFMPGKKMSVLTGETGAGKSIIIDSVNLILGSRVNKNLIRQGKDKAVIGAMFDLTEEICKILDDNGVELSEDTFIIQREITKDGKSISRINGTMVPASLLKELSPLLIDIHGQLDNQSLLTPSKHINYLDKYAKDDELLREYKEKYRLYKEKTEEYNNLCVDEEIKNARVDLLKYQTEEIAKAEPAAGELEKAEEELLLIANAEKIKNNVMKAYELLFDKDNCAYDLIVEAVTDLSKLSDFDKDIDEKCEMLNDFAYQIEDISREIRNKCDSVEYDEERMDFLNERIDRIKRLIKKYGGSIESTLDYYEKSIKELSTLENSDIEKERLLKEVKELKAEALSIAKKISKIRIKKAEELSERIEKELKELDISNAKFRVEIEAVSELNENGTDKVEFMFSANRGQDLKPLAAIASGGELSRTMLAMKTVLSDCDNVETMIFDEIDTGVSGNALEKIAIKMKNLSKQKQVICITHQAQLASVADCQFKISKIVENEETKTHIKMLESEERIKEIAVMIDGESFLESSLVHAKQMLEKGENRF